VDDGHRKAVCLLALPVFPAVQASAQQSADIAGTVNAGQSYEKAIGYALVFLIRADDLDFSIVIAAKTSIGRTQPEADDFTRCVTPPFHGPSPAALSA
jgi:hypothetical protein